jgi:eukaryotic-like serine/threonine-protein kinase
MAFVLTNARLNLVIDLTNKIGDDGSEGTIHHAKDIQLGADFAVKRIYRTAFDNRESDFFGEAKRLYDARHNHVAEVKYGCIEDDFVLIVMPYYKNGSLYGMMKSKNLTTRETLRYSLQFLSGLNYIHSKGMVHFDIKPQNILITDSNVAVITDFGVARYINHLGFAKLDGTTRLFAPPEYFLRSEHKFAFDIYQSGFCILRMCSGDAFIQAVANDLTGGSKANNFKKAIESGTFPDRKSFLPHVPLSLRKIIINSMDIDPDKRYKTVLDMINALAKIDGNLDWQYVKHNENHLEWFESIPEIPIERKVVATRSNGIWSIDVLKNGVPQKHLIENNLKDSELFTTLDSILHKTWKRLKK